MSPEPDLEALLRPPAGEPDEAFVRRVARAAAAETALADARRRAWRRTAGEAAAAAAALIVAGGLASTGNLAAAAPALAFALFWAAVCAGLKET